MEENNQCRVTFFTTFRPWETTQILKRESTFSCKAYTLFRTHTLSAIVIELIKLAFVVVGRFHSLAKYNPLLVI